MKLKASLIAAATLAQMIVGVAAHADCEQQYLDSAATYHKWAGVSAGAGTALSVGAVAAGPAGIIPLSMGGATILTTAKLMAVAEDAANSAELIAEGKAGSGDMIDRIAEAKNLSANEVVDAIRSLNDQNAICSGQLLRFNKLAKIVIGNAVAAKSK